MFDYIKSCSRSDPDINSCVANSISHLRSRLINGIPELEIPAIDPLKIPRIQMENGSGRIRVKAVFTNLTIYGSSNHTLTGVRANIDNYQLELSAKAPRLVATGRYEVLGNVLVFNIRSKGDFQAVFEDASGLAKLYGKEVVVNNVKYMKIEHVGVDFKVGKARFKIRDHGSGTRVLSEAINNFLNQNWKEVLEEMKHTASAAIGKFVKQIINTALLKVPLHLWLTED
ncbi:hypothetical protein RUM44_004130 [Polyplax serrata]|uniref:Protein takeout n=1 Tax=Polyplax serrata TaxID=468196 RepID=A0ABR1B2D5_POLSC